PHTTSAILCNSLPERKSRSCPALGAWRSYSKVSPRLRGELVSGFLRVFSVSLVSVVGFAFDLRQSLQFRNRDVENGGVDYAFALELHPDTVGPRPGKDHVELHLGPAIGDERMVMGHVDQVVTGGQHVGPCAEIGL